MNSNTRVVRFSRKFSCPTHVLRMRFDNIPNKPIDGEKERGTPLREGIPQGLSERATTSSTTASISSTTSTPSPSMSSWIARTVENLSHPSMKPKPVSPSFTPYPLPKYDSSMGFGPVFLKNIPDVYRTQQRMASAAEKQFGKGEERGEEGEREGVRIHTSRGTDYGFSSFDPSCLRVPPQGDVGRRRTGTPTTALAESREMDQSRDEEEEKREMEYHSRLPPSYTPLLQAASSSSFGASPRVGGIEVTNSTTPTTVSMEQGSELPGPLPMEEGYPAGIPTDSPSMKMTEEGHPHSSPPFPPSSYMVEGDTHLRVLDRLVCRRSLEDLLHQFNARPQREARTATILDLASTLSLRRTEELTRLFYEVTSVFSTSSGSTQAGGGGGVGLQFLVAKVVKFGRPYYVTDELMKAYLVLLSSATEYFVEKAPHHLFCETLSSSKDLSSSPAAYPNVEGFPSAALCIQLLHFMALLRVFQPNLWFSPNPNAPSNRGDYQHPRGVNRLTAYRRDGELLFDHIQQLVLESISSPPRDSSFPLSSYKISTVLSTEMVPSFTFLDQFSLQGLLNLLKGFAAVSPDSNIPHGEVSNIIWNTICQRLADGGESLFECVSSPSSPPCSTRSTIFPESLLFPFMEDLYFTLTLIGWVGDSRRDLVLQWLLASRRKGAGEQSRHTVSRTSTTSEKEKEAGHGITSTELLVQENVETKILSSLHGKQCFGPDFFAAASQEVDEMLKQKIVQGPLRETLLFYESCGIPPNQEGKHEKKGERGSSRRDRSPSISMNKPSFFPLEVQALPLYAVIESSREILMSLRSKTTAVSFAREHQYDRRCLELLSPCEEAFRDIGERLALEAAEREQTTPSALSLTYPLPSSPMKLSEDPPHSLLSKNVLSFESIGAPLALGHNSSRSFYLTRYKGQRVHPIRTFLSDLAYINQLHSVFLLHSSSVTTSAESVRSALQRARSGKEAVICTSSFLFALAHKVYYHHGGALTGRGKEKTSRVEEEVARRALSMLAQEIQKGRVVLLPFTEELLLHDPGVVCEEDLMLWTTAAFMAREIPHVKVHTLQHAFSGARQPHHALKGPHSPLRSLSEPLYSRTAPLLASLSSKQIRSVTHHVRLQQRVKDPPPRLHKVNPIRARFIYRRDKGIYDKIQITARHLAPGFAQGALDSDLRGLGYYTPDHPQVEYIPLAIQK